MSKYNLYKNLQNSKTEEDIKDVYIKALGFKSYTKGLIDIRTDEIWFEAKDKANTSSYKMFTQLLHYVQVALNAGEEIPPFLAAIDTEKAALMKTEDIRNYSPPKYGVGWVCRRNIWRFVCNTGQLNMYSNEKFDGLFRTLRK